MFPPAEGPTWNASERNFAVARLDMVRDVDESIRQVLSSAITSLCPSVNYETAQSTGGISLPSQSYTDAFPMVRKHFIDAWWGKMEEKGMHVKRIAYVGTQSVGGTPYAKLEFTVSRSVKEGSEGIKLCTDEPPTAAFYLIRLEQNCNLAQFSRSDLVMSGATESGATVPHDQFMVYRCPADSVWDSTTVSDHSQKPLFPWKGSSQFPHANGGTYNHHMVKSWRRRGAANL